MTISIIRHIAMTVTLVTAALVSIATVSFWTTLGRKTTTVRQMMTPTNDCLYLHMPPSVVSPPFINRSHWRATVSLACYLFVAVSRNVNVSDTRARQPWLTQANRYVSVGYTCEGKITNLKEYLLREFAGSGQRPVETRVLQKALNVRDVPGLSASMIRMFVWPLQMSEA